jgi:2,4-dienoyl-CoA reductase-like NADH-dependent reductase (Old Yellow Enzyme family)
MTKADIEAFKTAFAAAVRRALSVGFDVIEIHNAHGYLLHQFLSPVSNHRTDEYGGSFENRVRLTLEIVDITRSIVPADYPVFLRISASEWLDNNPDIAESFDIKQAIRLAPLLAEHGVDLLDVSSGGNSPLQKIASGPGYQVPFAKEIKEAVGNKMLVGTVGMITTGVQANEILQGGLDIAIAGRMFQKNPGLVWTWAEELGVEINIANQIRWGFRGRGRTSSRM